MFDSVLHSLIGSIKVKEDNDVITLSGFNGPQLVHEMSRVWNSSKVAKHMFTKVSRIEVSFRRFFLMDVVYTLEVLLKAPRVRINRRAVQKALEELKTQTSLKDIYDEEKKTRDIVDLSKLKDFHFSPKEYQLEYIKRYNEIVPRYKLKGHYLAAGVGTGKTINSLMLQRCLGSETTFVLSPKNAVIEVWRKTLNTAFKEPVTHWDSLLGIEPEFGKQYYVFHYEQLDKALVFIKKHLNRFGKVGIIIDEGHNFNEIKSDRTQRLISMVELTQSQNTLWMSGTPLKAMGKECVPFLKTIDPLFNLGTEKDFLGVFGNASDRALDILANRLGIVTYRVDSQQAMTSTKIIKHNVEVTLPNGKEYTLSEIRKKMEIFVAERVKYYTAHETEYKNDYLEAITWFKDTIANDDAEQLRFNQYRLDVEDVRKHYDSVKHKDVTPRLNKYEKDVIIPRLPDNLKKKFRKAKSVYKYVHLTILGEALGGVFGKIRTQCNVDIAANMHNVTIEDEDGTKYTSSLKDIIENGVKKTILFTSFVEVVQNTATVLNQQGFKTLQVYGETNKDLPKIVKEFGSNQDANPLIATFQSLSTAVPLIMASQVVMLNSPFREHDYTQAVARAHRLGNDVDVHVYDVFLKTIGEPNISTRSKDILDSTAKSVAIMLGIDKVDLGFGVESLEDLNDKFDLNELNVNVSNESVIEVDVHTVRKAFNW